MKTGQRIIDQYEGRKSSNDGMVYLMAALMISLTAPSSWAAEAAQSVMAPPSATAMTVSSGEDDASQATPRSANELNALPRPTRRTPDAAPSWNDSLPRPSSQTVIVLGIVAGLALVWRLTRGSEGNLPSDLVEVYGRVPLNPKQHLHLVRVGNTLLVLIESAQGLQRLAEISDPEEVRSITERFRRDGTGAVPPELSNVVSAGRHLASFRSA